MCSFKLFLHTIASQQLCRILWCHKIHKPCVSIITSSSSYTCNPLFKLQFNKGGNDAFGISSNDQLLRMFNMSKQGALEVLNITLARAKCKVYHNFKYKSPIQNIRIFKLPTMVDTIENFPLIRFSF